MNIAEITKKIGPKALIEAKNHLKYIYNCEAAGCNINQADIFHTLNNYYKTLKYQNAWLNEGLIDRVDFRFQTFARIESHTLSYRLSISSTMNDVENMINECLALDYSLEMAISSVGSIREVGLRISFWDRFFYSVEYFIQRMNAKYSFITNSSTHNKQHYFQEMLNFLKIGDATISTGDIIDLFKNHYPYKDSDFIKKIAEGQRRKSIKFTTLYEYAATLRNSLHNNGFSNKTLNNLDIGIAQYIDIKKGGFIECISAFHVLALGLAITEILQRITQKTIEINPGEIIPDPFTERLIEHLAAHEK